LAAARCAAKDAGRALALGQLQSGGWDYSIHFDPAERKNAVYRLDLEGKRLPDRVPVAERRTPHGWDVWKRRKYKGNVSTLDDDTTQAATRFLVRLDRALGQKDERIHDAAAFALTALLNVQYPSGGWSANFDRLQETPPSADTYPVKQASFPDDWPRKWPKNFTGCYVTNDDLMADMIDTLLVAWRVYGDAKHLAAARRAGDFLLLAQLPEPQPAWAQQYDALMQPVWSRAFEPPALSGRESQEIMKALIRLSRATGDKKYLEPIPRAIAYLRKSRLADGKLARFYELRTNRPMYFTRDSSGRHVLTYDTRRLATNYAFIVDCDLDEIEADYRLALAGKNRTPPPVTAAEVSKIVKALDERGAWVVPGRLRHHRLEPPSGVIDSQRFADNMNVLSRYLISMAKK
jgi:PelA/Pel-15E family pectate lyase